MEMSLMENGNFDLRGNQGETRNVTHPLRGNHILSQRETKGKHVLPLLPRLPPKTSTLFGY